MRVYMTVSPDGLTASLHSGETREEVAKTVLAQPPRKWAEGICQENGWTLLDERPALKRGPKPRAVAAKGHELYLSDAAWTRLQATASMRGVSASSLADEIFLKL